MQDGVRVVRVRNRSVWLRGRLNLSTPLGMDRTRRRSAGGRRHSARPRIPHRRKPAGDAGRRAAGRADRALAARHADAQHRARRAQIGVGSAAVAGAGAALRGGDRLDGAGSRRSAGGMGSRSASIRRGRASPSCRTASTRTNSPICRGARRSARATGWAMRRSACSWDACTPAKASTCWCGRFSSADVPGARLVIAGPDEGMLPTLQAALDERIVVDGLSRRGGSAGGAGGGGRVLPARDRRGLVDGGAGSAGGGLARDPVAGLQSARSRRSGRGADRRAAGRAAGGGAARSARRRGSGARRWARRRGRWCASASPGRRSPSGWKRSTGKSSTIT